MRIYTPTGKRLELMTWAGVDLDDFGTRSVHLDMASPDNVNLDGNIIRDIYDLSGNGNHIPTIGDDFLYQADANSGLNDMVMGNSIIQGWKQADPDFFSNPKLLNRGIGGQTTPQMLSRFEQDVIAVKPRAVLILAGTNDIAGNTGDISLPEIRDNIARMAQMALENNIQVVLCSVLPAFDYPWRPGRHPDGGKPRRTPARCGDRAALRCRGDGTGNWHGC